MDSRTTHVIQGYIHELDRGLDQCFDQCNKNYEENRQAIESCEETIKKQQNEINELKKLLFA